MGSVMFGDCSRSLCYVCLRGPNFAPLGFIFLFSLSLWIVCYSCLLDPMREPECNCCNAKSFKDILWMLKQLGF